MQSVRTRFGALAALLGVLATGSLAGAQERRDMGPPMMYAPGWVTVEHAGDTWDGVWTFDPSHHSMSGRWTDRQTGARVFARHMRVQVQGQQIVITRRGAGNYVGTIAPDGRSIHGTMSWVAGSFTAHM